MLSPLFSVPPSTGVGSLPLLAANSFPPFYIAHLRGRKSDYARLRLSRRENGTSTFFASMSAPLARSLSMRPSQPYFAARWRGVSPFCGGVAMAAMKRGSVRSGLQQWQGHL